MTVTPTSLFSTGAGAGTTGAASQTLDSQAFLELLVAQLTYQDPTSPMDTSELMAQTSQLAMVESITELVTVANEGFALQMRAAAAGLVGHQVTWTDADGTELSGTVDAVSYSGPVPTVSVAGTDVPLDHVTTVRAASS